MKTLTTLAVLTFSLSSFAQERTVLTSETALVNNTEAILVRTAETPAVVTVFMNVPMTRIVCTKSVRTGGARSRSRRCIQTKQVKSNEADKVKISFKNIPVLGGSEEETFKISAQQKKLDSENVIYKISTLETTAPYAVNSKGILGYDSFEVKLK